MQATFKQADWKCNVIAKTEVIPVAFARITLRMIWDKGTRKSRDEYFFKKVICVLPIVHVE